MRLLTIPKHFAIVLIKSYGSVCCSTTSTVIRQNLSHFLSSITIPCVKSLLLYLSRQQHYLIRILNDDIKLTDVMPQHHFLPFGIIRSPFGQSKGSLYKQVRNIATLTCNFFLVLANYMLH